ncbi:MAG: TIGR02186 family protein [Acidobacteriota bacterium]
MRAAAVTLMLTALAAPAFGEAQAAAPTRWPRVAISATFSGEEVFLYGHAPEGTQQVVAILEGPPAGHVRLMKKGRVALFWLGIRQYSLGGVPGLYLVHLSCPICQGLARCRHADDAALEPLAARVGFPLGPAAINARGELECLSGPLEAGEAERAFQGYWDLQSGRGLYRVTPNAVRLNQRGAYYHRFMLPSQAPEGRYTVTTIFLGAAGTTGTEVSTFFVRASGLVAWMTRLADRHAAAYGVFSIVIAVAAGWLAGVLFRRGGGH